MLLKNPNQAGGGTPHQASGGTPHQASGSAPLLQILDKLHMTEMGAERIKRNLGLQLDDPTAWCKSAILDAKNSSSLEVTRKGKNWYALVPGAQITINAASHTIITAHTV